MQPDKQIAATCPARHTCKQYMKLCGTGCPWYIDIRYQLELAGIPRRSQKWSVETLPEDTVLLSLLQKYAATEIEREPNNGLYLTGGTGSGKTTAACALAMSFIVNRTRKALATGELLPQLVQYVNVPDLIELIKRGFDTAGAAAEAQRVLNALKKAPRAILDDVGAERPTDYVRERLLQIINERYDNERITHFTSNLSLDQIEITLGKRIRSRIEGMTIQVDYQGADRRKKA